MLVQQTVAPLLHAGTVCNSRNRKKQRLNVFVLFALRSKEAAVPVRMSGCYNSLVRQKKYYDRSMSILAGFPKGRILHVCRIGSHVQEPLNGFQLTFSANNTECVIAVFEPIRRAASLELLVAANKRKKGIKCRIHGCDLCDLCDL